MSYSGTSILCAVSSLLLCACSLKEDRWECPCVLSVSADTGTAAPEALFLEYNIVDRNGNCISAVREINGKDDTLVASVSRGTVEISTLASSEKYSGSDMLIPLGNQASAMYAAFHSVRCENEDDSVRMKLCKQFAYLELTLTGVLDSIPECSIAVRGNVCGWKKSGLTPVPGNFYREDCPDDRNKVLFMVPRQLDNSLELIFIRKDDGRLLSTCKIGEEISSRGYDWDAKSLLDIRMSIQYSETEFSIVACDWFDGMIMDVEI